MALEDPRDKGTRGQRTSEGRTGPRDRSSGGGGVGGTKKAGNATVADHMIATGQIDVPSIGPKGVAQGNYNSQDDAYNDYSKAIGDYETRSWGGKVLDGILGGWFDQQAPISQNPRTFANGTYHTFSNPGSILGGFAGSAVAPGLGLLTGPLSGAAYNLAGGKNIAHGGYSQPDTGVYDDPTGGWGAASSGGLLGGGGPSRQQDNRGSQNATGLLGVGNQQAPAAATPLTAALPAQQQAAAIKKRAYDFGIGTVPGPSPYSFTTARWL